MAGGSSPVPAPIEIRFCSQLRSVRPQVILDRRSARFVPSARAGSARGCRGDGRGPPTNPRGRRCEGRTRAAGNREWRKEGARNLMVKNSSSAAHLRSGLTERKKNSSSTLLSVT
ncbi:hypothetical protein MUK42_24424 [Musa troglodytarum]|uniref:Uncharacterized protein n=1 Tax=Musa troglodytarum TaxID=320322 RepID=A0A9E7G958_9LILI|nr:hypothetical protein MUK42_24424 [Musa troglodytarum]